MYGKTTRNICALLVTTIFALQGFTQNVGIGTSNPAYKLDVSGRVRVRNSTQTAGIYFDAVTTSNQSFIGVMNDNHVGIWGAGSNWKLVMNVDNGNVGIGTTAPAASLDLSGTLRYRGGAFPNIPQEGSVLTSIDDNGNAQWQRPVVFKTNGLTAPIDVPGWQWTKVNFASSNLEVNEGFYYDPFNSRFNAPVKGIYHFDSKVYFFAHKNQTYMRLVVVRNGNIIKEYRDQEHVCATCYNYQIRGYDELDGKMRMRTLSVSVDTPLEKNDQVWMEVYASQFNESDGTPIDGSMQIQKEAHSTWFGGHLVYRY